MWHKVICLNGTELNSDRNKKLKSQRGVENDNIYYLWSYVVKKYV